MKSNSFDPDQVIHFIRSDLDPNFLQTADNTSRQRVSFCMLDNFACSFVVC